MYSPHQGSCGHRLLEEQPPTGLITLPSSTSVPSSSHAALLGITSIPVPVQTSENSSFCKIHSADLKSHSILWAILTCAGVAEAQEESHARGLVPLVDADSVCLS